MAYRVSVIQRDGREAGVGGYDAFGPAVGAALALADRLGRTGDDGADGVALREDGALLLSVRIFPGGLVPPA